MQKKLLMGNEAIALGAIRAGVRVVSGYPGTPSTEILETVARHNDGSIYVEWSVNEKVALEVAAGAAVSGARALVTMKQVGLNVASDPLMSLNYIGVKGGMVIAVADDPGPISSQTEQDTRNFARFAKVALFDPSTPEEAYEMVADAFDCSERYGAPVLLRPTTRVCHSYASVETLPAIARDEPEGFVKGSRWVIFPRLAFGNKPRIEENLNKMRAEFASYGKNNLTGGGSHSGKGIAAGGVSYCYAREALNLLGADCRLLKASTVPFPDKLALEFLDGISEALVIEELDPFIENELFRVCGINNISVKILGKQSGHTQIAGENTVGAITKAIAGFLGMEAPALAGTQTNVATVVLPENTPPLPVRPPVLCAGCSHRASFVAVKEATRGLPAVYTGDIGCYTLGNAMPLDMVDTCLCMGGGITMAQGLKRVAPGSVHFAFIGDSTFFHSGVTGVMNAVYNQTDIIVVILDNSTTAMTGGQPHPGTERTMMGNATAKLSIEKVVSALGAATVAKVNPFDQQAAKGAVRDAIGQKGVRVIIFEALCNNLAKPGAALAVDAQKCVGCGICTKKLGCPAISEVHEQDDEQGAESAQAIESQGGANASGPGGKKAGGKKAGGKRAVISPALCTGCGICAGLCKAGAIEGTEVEA